jgi:hypothetical protein
MIHDNTQNALIDVIGDWDTSAVLLCDEVIVHIAQLRRYQPVQGPGHCSWQHTISALQDQCTTKNSHHDVRYQCTHLPITRKDQAYEIYAYLDQGSSTSANTRAGSPTV